jgi:hypothetical protein
MNLIHSAQLTDATFKFGLNRIGGVLVSVLASSYNRRFALYFIAILRNEHILQMYSLDIIPTPGENARV